MCDGVVWLYLTAWASAQNAAPWAQCTPEADVVGGLVVLEGVGVGGRLLSLRRVGAEHLRDVEVGFSSSWLAVAISPTLQPALVYGTHGAGATVVGETGEDAVAGGTGEYTMLGLVSWPAFGVLAVSSIGSVQ